MSHMGKELESKLKEELGLPSYRLCQKALRSVDKCIEQQSQIIAEHFIVHFS